MVLIQHLLLLLATASVNKVFASEPNWNDNSLYPGVDFTKADVSQVDWTKVKYPGDDDEKGEPKQSDSGNQTPPVQQKYVDQDDGGKKDQDKKESSTSTTPNSSEATGSTDYVGSDTNGSDTKGSDTKGSDTEGNGHGDDGSKECPPGCQMNIKFSKNSKAVDYTAGEGGHPKTGKTKDSCICMSGGSVRVNIGTKETGHHTTLIEGNAVGLGHKSFYDVSYVEGFSLPVVCWFGADDKPETMSGHNEDLWGKGNHCAKVTQVGDVKICENPGYTELVHETEANKCLRCTNPSDFFAPAAGAAYTYPYDDAPCASGPDTGTYRSPMATGGDLTCCVGSDCPKNSFSKGGTTVYGACNRGDCTPCTREQGLQINKDLQVSATACSKQDPCLKGKRDLQSLFEGVAERPRSKKRHSHHHHAAVHGST